MASGYFFGGAALVCRAGMHMFLAGATLHRMSTSHVMDGLWPTSMGTVSRESLSRRLTCTYCTVQYITAICLSRQRPQLRHDSQRSRGQGSSQRVD